MKKNVLIIVVFCAVVLAALIYTSLGSRQFRCEVCVTFNGVKNCRISSSRTKESAQRTATENACAAMEHSMTDRMTCPNTPPDSVKWLSLQ